MKRQTGVSLPHFPGPDLVTAGAEAVDDNLGRQRDVEVGGGDGGGVEIIQHLRRLVISSTINRLFVTFIWLRQDLKESKCPFVRPVQSCLDL